MYARLHSILQFLIKHIHNLTDDLRLSLCKIVDDLEGIKQT